MLSSGANVIILKLMLSCGTKCYHMGPNVIIWSLCYHVGRNVTIMGRNVSSGSNFIMWSKCYHLGTNVINVEADVAIWSILYQKNVMLSFVLIM